MWSRCKIRQRRPAGFPDGLQGRTSRDRDRLFHAERRCSIFDDEVAHHGGDSEDSAYCSVRTTAQRSDDTKPEARDLWPSGRGANPEKISGYPYAVRSAAKILRLRGNIRYVVWPEQAPRFGLGGGLRHVDDRDHGHADL